MIHVLRAGVLVVLTGATVLAAPQVGQPTTPAQPAAPQAPAGQTPPASTPPAPQTPTPAPAAAGAPPSAAAAACPAPVPPATAPARAFTAETGLLLYPVQSTRVADFERFLLYVRDALVRTTDPTLRNQARGWKFYRVTEVGPNGDVIYAFLLDPAVRCVDYALGPILAAAYPDPAQLQEIWKLYTTSVRSGGTIMNLNPLPLAPPPPIATPPATPPGAAKEPTLPGTGKSAPGSTTPGTTPAPGPPTTPPAPQTPRP